IPGLCPWRQYLFGSCNSGRTTFLAVGRSQWRRDGDVARFDGLLEGGHAPAEHGARTLALLVALFSPSTYPSSSLPWFTSQNTPASGPGGGGPCGSCA